MKSLLAACSIGLVIGATAAAQSPVHFQVGEATTGAGQTIELPISVRNAVGIGAFQMTVEADSAVVSLVEARLAAGLSGLVETESLPNGLRIKTVFGQGLPADSEVLILDAVLADGASGQTDVRLTDLRVWTFDPILELGSEVGPGLISVADDADTWHWLLPVAGGLVLLLSLALLARTVFAGKSRSS